MKKTRQTISLLLSVLMIASTVFGMGVTSFAAENDILSYLTYEITDGEVTITDCDTSISGDVVIPDTIEGYPVTAIDEYCFFECNALANITIPYSITTIADNAFINCTGLESITVDENNQYYLSDEYGVLFNKEKTILCQYPLGNTRTSYTISDGVLTVGINSFPHCKYLETVIIADSVTKIDDFAFNMYDCGINNLKNVVLGENVSYIGAYAFNSCSSIESINLPDKLTYIGEKAFEGCGIKNIEIPNNVTTIGFCAFSSCDLERVTIPESVETIEDSAFANCYNLTDISVDENNKYYASDEYGVLFNKYKTELIQYPIGNERTEYSIPDGVERISSAAFSARSDSCYLEKIMIPASVWSVGYYIFSSCTNLENIIVDENNAWYSSDDGILYNKDKTELVRYPIGNSRTEYTVPDGVTTIGQYAFDGCFNIERVIISDSVSSIGYYAFQQCINLNSITILNPICSIYDGWGTFWAGDIYGYPNSTAQLYAEKYNFTFVSLCDNHSLSSVVTDPTCTEQGYTTYTCAECGVVYNSDFVDKKGHLDNNSDDCCDVCENMMCYVININETIAVDIISAETTFIKFIPDETAVYTFYSESINDTVGFLFDSHMNELAYDDDSGEGNNFLIEYQLIKGEKYYFGCRYYSTAESGCFDVTLKSELVAEPPYEEETNIFRYLTYKITDGEITIIACDTSISDGIVVPDMIEGYPVTVIGDGAFSNCISLANIVLPDTVKTIKNNAFGGCTSLKKVIASGVESIGENAFADCDILDTVLTFAESLEIADSSFDTNEKLTVFVKNTAEITAPDTLDVITFTFADGILSFSGEYKSDLYYLFDLVAMMCTYYDDVQYLFFDSFEAVSADDGHIYYYTDNWQRIEFDGTKITNVKFSVEAFDGEEFRKYSFNELCESVGNNNLENFNLVIEEADDLDRGSVEISLVDQVNQMFQRILKALTNLINKLFSFFKKLGR